jgi:hypothetical protein
MEQARFTEGSNSIDYLEKAISFIKTAENNPQDWKWVVLAVHGALYGFMICTLKGSAIDNVSVGKKQKLIGFNEALKRCQDPAYKSLGGFTDILQLSEKQHQALGQLSSYFRNKFAHYDGAYWSIPPDLMREIVTHSLDALSAVLGMGCWYPRFEPGDSEKIAALVAEGIVLLQKGSSGDNAAA